VSRRRRAPTRADLLVLVLLVAAIPLAARWPPGGAAGAVLRLQSPAEAREVDPKIEARYELRGPVGVTSVRVAGGEAWIERSDCRNRLCVRMGRLRGPGRALVCMPNRVVVRFAAAAAPGVPDAITR
jgi:hypothetical protein